jgi:hypothetical protein
MVLLLAIGKSILAQLLPFPFPGASEHLHALSRLLPQTNFPSTP